VESSNRFRVLTFFFFWFSLKFNNILYLISKHCENIYEIIEEIVLPLFELMFIYNKNYALFINSSPSLFLKRKAD
jgi:hypothetical protein